MTQPVLSNTCSGHTFAKFAVIVPNFLPVSASYTSKKSLPRAGLKLTIPEDVSLLRTAYFVLFKVRGRQNALPVAITRAYIVDPRAFHLRSSGESEHQRYLNLRKNKG